MASAMPLHFATGERLQPLRRMLPIQRVHNFGTYFVTFNCASKWTIFQVERTAELLFQTFQHYREHYKLHAFAIMPDHVHLLLTPQAITLERCLQLIKGGFSRQYHLQGGLKDVWQKGFADHRCRDREDYLKHKRYVEQNPVSAGLAQAAEDYPWSSASRTLRNKHSLSG